VTRIPTKKSSRAKTVSSRRVSLAQRLVGWASGADHSEGGGGRILAVWMLSLCLAGLAALIGLTQFRGAGVFAPDNAIPWWSLIPIFAVVEVLVVHIDLQRETQTISLSEVPIVLGLFLVDPLHLILAQVVGSSIALVAHRRQAPIKLAFNLAQFALVTVVALSVFRALAPPTGDIGPFAWVAAVLATMAADIVAVMALNIVVGLVDGSAALPGLKAFVGFGFACTVANSALGLLGVVLLVKDPAAGALLLVPVTITIVAYRGYWAEHRRREHLEFLYDSMRRLGGAPDFDGAVAQLLRDAREVFRSGTALVVLTPAEPGALPMRASVTADGQVDPLREVTIDTALLTSGDGEPVTHISGALLPRLLAGRAVSHAISVQLVGEHGPVGVLLVTDRRTEIGGFTGADRALLRTYATHAGVALENRRLQRFLGELSRANSELATQALHDPLTQLPNRVLFVDRVSHALTQNDDGSSNVGVLFVDLDDFKAVNDNHGHAAGDQVLMAFAERLRACLRPGDTAARFGGDEFAVLLCDIAGAEEAQAVAGRLLEALRQPVIVAGTPFRVRASVGIAVGRCGGAATADSLIKAADGAMYEVKFRDRPADARRDRAGRVTDTPVVEALPG
jgi:diguanylate cyclase (GGDEF)-like protein